VEAEVSEVNLEVGRGNGRGQSQSYDLGCRLLVYRSRAAVPEIANDIAHEQMDTGGSVERGPLKILLNTIVGLTQVKEPPVLQISLKLAILYLLDMSASIAFLT